MKDASTHKQKQSAELMNKTENIAFQNINGIRNKDDELLKEAKKRNWLCVGVSEMKLRKTDMSKIQRDKDDEWRWIFGDLDDTPKGGVAMLYNRTKMKNISVTHKDKNIISIRDSHRKAIFITVYMPSGSTTAKRLEREQMYDTLERVINERQTEYDIILGGDFNGRIRANGDTEENESGRRMKRFARETDLTITNELDKCNDKYTRVQTMKERVDRSTLDYIIVNEHVLPSITSLRLLQRQRGSDHKVTELNLEREQQQHERHTDSTPKAKKGKATPTIRFNIDRIGKRGWGRYAEEVQKLMSEWAQYKKELEDLGARDEADREATCELMEIKLREIITTAAVEAIGVREVSKRKRKSYIDAEVSKLIEDRDEAERKMNKAHASPTRNDSKERQQARTELMTR